MDADRYSLAPVRYAVKEQDDGRVLVAGDPVPLTGDLAVLAGLQGLVFAAAP